MGPELSSCQNLLAPGQFPTSAVSVGTPSIMPGSAYSSMKGTGPGGPCRSSVRRRLSKLGVRLTRYCGPAWGAVMVSRPPEHPEGQPSGWQGRQAKAWPSGLGFLLRLVDPVVVPVETEAVRGRRVPLDEVVRA